MKTIIFVYHDMGYLGIGTLLAAGYETSAIFTHTDNPGEKTFYDPTARLAAERGVPVYASDNVNHPSWVGRIAQLSPEVIFSFYYRHLICDEILRLAPRGAFNLHDSLLPKYRGRAPLNWVLVNGETETGVALRRVVEHADAGAIVAQLRVVIVPGNIAITLHHRLCHAARQLLGQTLPTVKHGNILEIAQRENEVTCFGRRTPNDSFFEWRKLASVLHSMVHAIADPWPGTFNYVGSQELAVWLSRVHPHASKAQPGSVISIAPLLIACGDGALEIVIGQADDGITIRGSQLAQTLDLMRGSRLNSQPAYAARRRIRVLIFGINSFIGNHLAKRLLREDYYRVYSLDIGSGAISRFLNHPHLHFVEGDISIHSEWIEYHVKKCDIVLPLVVITTPIEYARNPLRVLELNFEENLRIIRYCVKYRKRAIFPSTSEAYGMCSDKYFDEDHSSLIIGPVDEPRWIYPVSKQLLDRVIWIYGGKEDLQFTLFRPLNWMGPQLDNLNAARIGSSHATTRLVPSPIEGSPIKLIDDGGRRRYFTDIRDDIEALYRVIKNAGNHCGGEIINIGSPENETSIEELGEMLLASFEKRPLRHYFPPSAGFRVAESSSYYGKGCQDVEHHKPSIRNTRHCPNWEPKIDVQEAIDETLNFFLHTTDLTDKPS